MFFSSGKEVYTLVNNHLEAVGRCYDEFIIAVETLFNKGSGLEIEELAMGIDKLESEADDIRHEIIKTILEGALLPESRREILKLIEMTDEVANMCEEIIRCINLQGIVFHSEFKQCIESINKKTKEQFMILCEAIGSLFKNYKALENFEKIKKIELLESEVDVQEQCAIKKVYSMNLTLAEKNQLRDIISKISDISDVIEDISDMIEIIMALKKV